MDRNNFEDFTHATLKRTDPRAQEFRTRLSSEGMLQSDGRLSADVWDIACTCVCVCVCVCVCTD